MLGRLLSRRSFDEFRSLSAASDFMSDELGIKVVVQKAGARGVQDPANKAKDALPTKPAFFLE
jgi:hypothetical protein